jgi:hypothetical protein
MKKIDEKDFEKKLAESPKDLSFFISNLYVDPILEQLVGEDTEDYLLIVDDLANQIAYYVLGLLSTQEFKENLAEILYLDNSVQIQKAYDAINKFVLSKRNSGDSEKKTSLEDIKFAEANHISHIDVLSEIENPTPSISAPLTPQREATTESQATPNSLKPSSKDSSTQLSSPNPSLHSSPSIAPYVNPALHIASKLDQNLSNPSASVPKEMYVSKKPDPYHEPLDL